MCKYWTFQHKKALRTISNPQGSVKMQFLHPHVYFFSGLKPYRNAVIVNHDAPHSTLHPSGLGSPDRNMDALVCTASCFLLPIEKPPEISPRRLVSFCLFYFALFHDTSISGAMSNRIHDITHLPSYNPNNIKVARFFYQKFHWRFVRLPDYMKSATVPLHIFSVTESLYHESSQQHFQFSST